MRRYTMGLTCPSCNVAFHPQFFHQLVGFKKKKFDSVYVYYQLCPQCEEPIIGYREIKSGEFPAFVDPESLLLMTRKK
jgi:hypothetical protein